MDDLPETEPTNDPTPQPLPNTWVPTDYDKRANALNQAVTYLGDNTGDDPVTTAKSFYDFLIGAPPADA